MSKDLLLTYPYAGIIIIIIIIMPNTGKRTICKTA
jgi:hypothetical protein